MRTAGILVAVIAAAAVAIGATIFLLPAGPSAPTELKVATLRGACGISFTEVLDSLGTDLKAGVDVVMVPLDGVPVEVDALLRGEVDVAIIPVEFLPDNVGKGTGLRLLLMDMSQYQALVAQPSIDSVAKLDGKRIGVFKPTSTYLTLQAYLREAGFRITEGDPKPGEVALVNLPIPAMPDALQRREVDAVATIGPTTIQSVEKGGVVVSTFGEWSGRLGLKAPAPLITFVTTNAKLQEKKAGIDALLRARQSAVEDWVEADKVVGKLYTERCGLPGDMAAKYHQWLLSYIWRGPPVGDEVVQGIQDHLTLLAKHNIVGTGGPSIPEVLRRLLGR